MEKSAFEASLHDAGFTDIAISSKAPHHATQPHAHDFEVRALVLEGEITLGVDGTSTRYAAGQTFTMPGGREHTETVGSAGVTTLAGRRYAA